MTDAFLSAVPSTPDSDLADEMTWSAALGPRAGIAFLGRLPMAGTQVFSVAKGTTLHIQGFWHQAQSVTQEAAPSGRGAAYAKSPSVVTT